jgi:hypothetical protein
MDDEDTVGYSGNTEEEIKEEKILLDTRSNIIDVSLQVLWNVVSRFYQY